MTRMKGALLSRMILFFFFLGGVLLAQTAPSISADIVYVGILDDDRKEMANWKPGVAQHRVVRPAFEKIGSVWTAVSSIPQLMTWTIAFDGKNMGPVRSATMSRPKSLTLEQSVVEPAAVPIIGSPSQDFAGLMAIGPGKVRRPMVLVSKPYTHDPDGWKRLSIPTSEVAALVRKAFRKEFPKVDRCKDEEIVEHDWNFPDSALSLPIAYRSNKNSFLVQTKLDAGDCGYVDDPHDPLSRPWFFISAGGEVRRIGSFMSLLDAGDYDNDGNSELIFFLSQPEDTDGFILFDRELNERVRLSWSYH